MKNRGDFCPPFGSERVGLGGSNTKARIHSEEDGDMSFEIDHCSEDLDIDIPLDFNSKTQEVTDYR